MVCAPYHILFQVSGMLNEMGGPCGMGGGEDECV
jgi:hypothetical protein